MANIDPAVFIHLTILVYTMQMTTHKIPVFIEMKNMKAFIISHLPYCHFYSICTNCAWAGIRTSDLEGHRA